MIILAIVLNIVLVAIDQITKKYALNNIKEVGSVKVIDGFLNFTFVENRGAAFGVLQNARWFFIIITLIILIGIAYYYIKLPQNKVYFFVRISLILISSGAIGNFIDRLVNGYVIDFLDPVFIKFMNFPVFNVADIYVVSGTFLLAILLIFFIKEEKVDGDK